MVGVWVRPRSEQQQVFQEEREKLRELSWENQVKIPQERKGS